MSMTKDLHEVLLLAKEDSLCKVKNNKYFEQSTIEFFDGIFEVLNNMMNDVIDTEKMEDFCALNFQLIYMLMKANKKLKHLTFCLDEDEFVMKNMHRLTSIKQRIEEHNKMKSEDKSQARKIK